MVGASPRAPWWEAVEGLTREDREEEIVEVKGSRQRDWQRKQVEMHFPIDCGALVYIH